MVFFIPPCSGSKEEGSQRDSEGECELGRPGLCVPWERRLWREKI